MNTINLTGASIFIVLIAFLVPPLLNKIAEFKQAQEHFAQEFFQLAPKLIADDRLPLALATILSNVSIDFLDARVVRHIILLWAYGHLGEGADAKGQGLFEKEFQRLSPELQQDFGKTIGTGLIGMSYSSLFFGWALRRFLFAPLNLRDRPEAATIFGYQAVHDQCAA